MQKVKCNNCEWTGTEDELIIVGDPQNPAENCPKCGTYG
jgi:NAD-dependent SIR2 family protein deacetylase